MSRGRLALAVCAHCDEIFGRRTYDLARVPRTFCSRECYSSEIRTGRTIVELICVGCATHFQRVKDQAARTKVHYCTVSCYEEHADRSAMGKAGGAAPHEYPPGFKEARSRLAGLAKFRKMTQDDRKAFSRTGVEARKAMFTRKDYSAISKRSSFTRRIGHDVVLGVRLGKRTTASE